MHKEPLYSLNRGMINGIIIISLIIPLLVIPDINLSPESPVSEIREINFGLIPAGKNLPVQNNFKITGTSFSIFNYLPYLYFAGLILFLIFPVIGYSRIFRIIKKSKINNYPDYKLAVSEENITAFNLGRYIVISKTDLNTNGDIILSHEKAHLRYKHSIDTIIWQIFRIIFWFNPFYMLLQNNLRQVHEFQADRYTINSGIDATKYQLTLIKKSVGPGRYALANSLIHCQIKKRITMMNIPPPGKKARWKMLVFLPLIIFLLFSFSKDPVNNIDNFINNIQDPVQKKMWTIEDFKTKIIIHKEGLNIIEDYPEITQSFQILMNKNSELLVNEKFCKLNIVSNYVKKVMDYDLSDQKTKSHFKKMSGKYYKNKMVSTSGIFIAADRSVNKDDYSKLLNEVGNAILSIRNKYSESIFNSKYSSLNKEKKEDIDNLVPLNVFLVKSRKVQPPPPKSGVLQKANKNNNEKIKPPVQTRISQIKISNPAKIEFEEVSHDFGIIVEGERVVWDFKFKNTGGSDLIISHASSTCGCIIPAFSKKPIPPGKEGKIEVVFNSSNKPGSNHYNVRIMSNTQPNVTVLELTAEV